MVRPDKLLGVEASRGIAALLVVLVHAGSMLSDAKYLGELPLGGLFKFAHAGVDFFFVLSGFIIFHIHARDIGVASAWPLYVKKRLLRIFPAYWVVLALYAVILYISPTSQRFEQIPSVAVAAVFLMPHPLGPVLGPAWSLSHELLFYALFSLLLLVGRFAWPILVLWGLGTAAQQLWSSFGEHFLLDQFFFRIFNLHFFMGIGVAWLSSRRVRWRPELCLMLGVLVFFSMGVWESWGMAMKPEWAPAHLAYGLGSACALYGLVTLEQQGRLKVTRPLVALGTASYSVYLVHVIVIMIWQQGLLRLPWLLEQAPSLTYLLTVLIAMGAGLVFHYLVEAPLSRLLQRLVLGAK